MIKIISPYKNLGCLGFKFGKSYIDFFVQPYLGMYASVATKQITTGIILRHYMLAVTLVVKHAFKNPTRLYWERILK